MSEQIPSVVAAFAAAEALSRKRGISLHQAYEITAQKAGHPNWNQYINALRDRAAGVP